MCDGVVQFSGEALAFFESGGLLRLLVESGIFDGGRRTLCDGEDESHIFIVEGAWFAVVDVEDAEDGVIDDDGDVHKGADVFREGDVPVDAVVGCSVLNRNRLRRGGYVPDQSLIGRERHMLQCLLLESARRTRHEVRSCFVPRQQRRFCRP